MTDIATQQAAGVPALYTPQVSADLDASDIRLPKLKIGQYMSPQVQEGLAKAGDLFTHTTAEDADVIRSAGAEGVPVAEGVEFYVLSIRKGWSITEAGELVTFADDDPSRPQEAWRTYTYTIAIPEVDEQLPFNLLLTRTSLPAGKQINLLVKKREASGPGYELAFKLGSKKRENAKGKFYVAQVTTAPEPENAKDRKAREAAIAVATDLAGLVQPAPSHGSTDDGEPSI